MTDLREADTVDGDVSGEVIACNVNQGASVIFDSTFKEKQFDPCRMRCRKVTEDGVSTECTVSNLSCRTVQLFVVASDTRVLPTKNPPNGIKHEEPPSPDEDIDIIPEACITVNMQEGYDNCSTQGVLEAVEIKGKHTLSLGGKDVISHSSWFKEYSHTVHNNPHGSPEYTVYFYECYEFPGHYIHWHDVDQGYVVDCEPKIDTPCSNQFQWKKKFEAKNGGMQFNWLLANTGNSSEVSPFYLSFQDDQPKIQQNIDSAMEFFIKPAKPDPSA